MRKQFLRVYLCAVLCVVAVSQTKATLPKASASKAHLQRAEAALRANDIETAVREYRAVLALDPKNAEAHTNLGIIAFSHGDCGSASTSFRDALSVDPSLAKAQALLGVCLMR